MVGVVMRFTRLFFFEHEMNDAHVGPVQNSAACLKIGTCNF